MMKLANNSHAPKTLSILVLLLPLTFLASIGCQKSDGVMEITVERNADRSAAPPNQNQNTPPELVLFKNWTESRNTARIDMTHCAFNETKTANIAAITGETCSCQLLVVGTVKSGNMTFSSCTSNTCSQFTGVFAYTNTATGLSACRSGNCYNFK